MLPKPSSSRTIIVTLLGLCCACGLLAAARLPVRAAPAAQVLFPSATPTPADAAAAQISTPAPPPATATPSRTPTRPATRTPSRTPSRTPTRTPTRVTFPEATVLVERLRVRSGPDTTFPIVTRVFVGDTVRVTGQTGDCAWLRVLTPEGVAGWISAEGLVTLNVACATIPRSVALVRTPTPTPTATNTATPTLTPTPSKSPVPPVNLRPFVGPRTPTPAPLPAVRPFAGATVAPAAMSAAAGAAEGASALPTPTPDRRAALATGGPTAVGDLFPEAGWVGRVRLGFSWAADAPLAPGQVYELAFWQPGQSPAEGVGWTAATTEPGVSINLYDQVPGDYVWGIWLGGFVDGAYQRIRYLGGGNTLRILPEGGGSDSGPPATPVNNCPPDAPCRP